MRIVIAYTNPFPYGDANANRLISYAKELVKQGHSVHVHCLQPSVRPSDLGRIDVPKPSVEGCFEGITYCHTAGSVIWPESGHHMVRKGWIRIKSYFRSFATILREHRDIDILQVCVANTFSFYFYHVISRIFGIKFVVERGELPGFVKHPELYRGAKGRLTTLITLHSYRFFDGWILETQSLVDYYMTVAKKNVPYCIVPMTVEEERFTELQKDTSRYGRYVAYCGNMREDDGISILIKAFAKISSRHADVKLLLAGHSVDLEEQKKLVAELGIDNQVMFLGRLSRNDVPQFLMDAEVLALASPRSIRASATMPCKVGEYMCTGNPVVVTGQGEIFKYLFDGVNAFLANPDDVDDFAGKLDYVLSNPEEASCIGEKGRESALADFGSATQAKRIAEFYSSL